jgi:mono/diheme cytochrome c family protein
MAAWCAGGATTAAAADGKALFESECAGCHSIGEGIVAGPDLAGINDRRHEDWLIRFIKSEQARVKSGDKIAIALFEHYKVGMPDQALSDEQIKTVLAHIKASGGGAATGNPSAGSPAQAGAGEPATDEVRKGRDLFEGGAGFAKGGPSCNACHNVANGAAIGGGILANELTMVSSRMGKEWVSSVLGNSPFPVMQAAYEGKALSADEIRALVGFLQSAEKQQAFQQHPGGAAWRLFGAGAGGVVLLSGFFSLVGRRRKVRSVNQGIYDRQIKSQ